MKKWHLIICVLVSVAIGFVTGTISHRNEPIYRDVVKTDTLVIRDTITQIKPVSVLTEVRDSILVYIHDTVTKVIYLSREVKRYQNEHYTCEVSGIQPSLDWIEVYPEQTVITNEVQNKTRPKRWGLGVTLGYGATIPKGGPVRFSPYIGVGISYNIITW